MPTRNRPSAPTASHPFKSERVAMEEVRRNLVLYEVPQTTKPAVE